ncbi:hypothetical protein GGR55DRAFT_660796 [Xylaria sp. FL0064]|nr:hypothetical protein GGR55DRAFT_660796 [Xylaria sp. FL0064]
MPRKVRLPADSAQNRENQQRSRARRRAYHASLEARVREFEARDMTATLEMQRAAREVAWANERLVELLATMGVTRGQVDEFLSRCREERERECGAATGVNPDSGSNQESAAGVAKMRRTSQIKPVARGGVDKGAEGDDGVVLDPLKLGTEIDGSAQALVTSCDAAASIIAGFHGHGDVSRARMVLGCDDAASCHVKNTRLFQLMDEPGGA